MGIKKWIQVLSISAGLAFVGMLFQNCGNSERALSSAFHIDENDDFTISQAMSHEGPITIPVHFSDSFPEAVIQSYLDHCKKITNRSSGRIQCERTSSFENTPLYMRIHRLRDPFLKGTKDLLQCTIDWHERVEDTSKVTNWNPRYFTERLLDYANWGGFDLNDVDPVSNLPYRDSIEKVFRKNNPGAALPDFIEFPGR